MKKLITLFFIGFIGTGAMSQNDFKSKFDQGLLYLSSDNTDKAVEIFEELHGSDRENMNLKYLLGQAYAKSKDRYKEAVPLLKQAKKAYSPDYKKLDAEEKLVSEYVYYYLLMAYNKSGKCDLTLNALNDFYSVYSYENEWFLIDAQKLHQNCKPAEEEEEEAPDEPIKEEEKRTASKEINEKQDPDKRKLIATKPVSYTYKGDEYGVQVGAFIEPVYTYEFPGLRNIEVYVDDNGVYRYIMGRFMFPGQAERLLKHVKQAGYEEAFIVNLKNKKKFSDQVVTIDHENVNKRLVGKVDFRVQVGAFEEDTIPDEMMELYLQLDSINQVQTEDMTILTVGSFETYEAATFYKELVQDLGIEDAFVAAFNYNRKVDIKEAILYIEDQKEAIKKRQQKEAEIYNK